MELLSGDNSSASSRNGCSIFSEEAKNIVVILELVGAAILSIAILIILSFLKRRVNCALNCCNGRPGLPVPMDFLQTPHHRWIYVALFGVMVVFAIETIESLNAPLDADGLIPRLLVKFILLPLVTILIVTFHFFPLFACADASVPFVGHVMGFVYSIVWFSIKLTADIFDYSAAVGCSDDGSNSVVVDVSSLVSLIFQDAPNLIVSGFVVIWYGYQVVIGVVRFCKRRRQKFGDYSTTHSATLDNHARASSIGNIHHVARVKALFQRPVVEESGNEQGVRHVRKFLLKVWRYLVPYDKHFQLPVSFLGTVAAMLMFVYQLCFKAGIFLIGIAQILRVNFDPTLLDSLPALRDVVTAFLTGLLPLVVVSMFLSFLLCVLLLFHMIGSVSKKMKEYARTGFTESLPGAISRMESSWEFVGVQVGYFFAAYAFYALVLFAAGTAILVLYALLRIPVTRVWLINIAVGILLPIVISRAISFSQYLFCKCVFFVNEKGKFISITNRNLYNWFYFIFYFYNGISGFFGALLRVGISAVVTFLLLFRLDEETLPKKFARFDSGHRKFLGFAYMNYLYNNAVLHVFIKVLHESVSGEMAHELKSSGGLEADREVDLDTWRSRCTYPLRGISTPRRIRNRWLVAYTLVRNPSLQELTASNLSSGSNADKKEGEEEEAGSRKEEQPEKVEIQEVSVQLNV